MNGANHGSLVATSAHDTPAKTGPNQQHHEQRVYTKRAGKMASTCSFLLTAVVAATAAPPTATTTTTSRSRSVTHFMLWKPVGRCLGKPGCAKTTTSKFGGHTDTVSAYPQLFVRDGADPHLSTAVRFYRRLALPKHPGEVRVFFTRW